MDIFGRKRIHELEYQLATEQGKRRDAEHELDMLKEKFDAMSELEENKPEDCIRGPWCESCSFVKTFYRTQYYGLGTRHTVTAYVCGKGKSCANFVQQKKNEEE